MKTRRIKSFFLFLIIQNTMAFSATDIWKALKRSQYLLNLSVPTQSSYDSTMDETSYKQKVRFFIEQEAFYKAVLRYHEKLFGVGLPTEYIDELMRADIDQKTNKFAQISCETSTSSNRLTCQWASASNQSKVSSCPTEWQEPVSIFWYPGLVAWVCPSLTRTCGNDLSRCFIEYKDQAVAANTELGSTEAFDSRHAVIKSLSKQPAGLATAVVWGNYPYTKILEPGIFAIDGAIAHFYRQKHHFDLNKLHLPSQVIEIAETIPLTDTKFHLIYVDAGTEQAGILSAFGWLRRYEKNRTRANQLYQRLLCRQFTSQLPRIFPQDPGNLRVTPGCSGCHATLDPLADFYKSWGEGGELYKSVNTPVTSSFGGHSGASLKDLGNIIRNDNAFATCTVEHAWDWLIGRGFYAEEAGIRSALTSYFITVGYSFKELIYAIATHPTFMDGQRSDGLVLDPLSEPPLGEPPGGNTLAACPEAVTFDTDIAPRLSLCTSCHATTPTGGAHSDLTTKAQWDQWSSQAISFMTSGQMPPSGQSGPPRIGPVFDLKEAVRCWVERGRL